MVAEQHRMNAEEAPWTMNGHSHHVDGLAPGPNGELASISHAGRIDRDLACRRPFTEVHSAAVVGDREERVGSIAQVAQGSAVYGHRTMETPGLHSPGARRSSPHERHSHQSSRGPLSHSTDLQLLASDGRKFIVSARVAAVSKTIEDAMQLCPPGEPIPLLTVDSHTLTRVLEHCRYHCMRLDAVSPSTPAATERARVWDTQFVEVSADVLFELVRASAFLRLDELHDLCCRELSRRFSLCRHAADIANLVGCSQHPAQTSWA